MDIETVYMFFGVFLLSSVMLVVLQRLFKNKSYEEVIAEQRQQTNALYNNQQKPKVKDKKQKKALKKSKEKKSSLESNEDVVEEISDHIDATEELPKEESEVTPVQPEVQKASSHAHAHVEFKEATVIEEPMRDSKKEEKINTEKKKKQQVSSTADKKSKHQVNEIISKSEKENVPEIPAPVVIKEKEKEPQEVKEEALPLTVVQNGISAVPIKDKKKKKSELNALTQNNEKSVLGVNLAHMITLVRKADMSKQDVQTLIDVLLNKQHDAPSIINEWSEGKGDPVQKLKKQLAEKTQLATELQETITGAQNKLREVRADQIQERAQHNATLRELQDRLNAFKHEKINAEQQLQNLTIKCQQLQEVANDEANKSRQIMELTVANLQREVADFVKQHKVDLQTIMQLQAELEKSRNDSFEMRTKYDMLLNTEQQKYTNELDTLREKLRNMEINKETDHKAFQKQIEDAKKQNTMSHEVFQKQIDNAKKQLAQDHKAFQKQIEDANKEAVKTNNDLRLVQEKHNMALREIEKLNEEYTKQVTLNNSMQEENHKLKEEIQKIQAKTNGSGEMDKQHQVLISQLTTDLKNVKNLLVQSEECSRAQLSTLKKQYDSELEELKNKNNDLRKKNWKVMEALNAAENRVKSSIQSNTQIPCNEKLELQISKEDSKETRTKFLKRLFPSIEVSSELSDNEWDKTVQDAVRDYIVACTTPKPPSSPAKQEPANVSSSELGDDSAEIVRLKAKVSTYEKIISESEVILCQLQTQVEEEQIRWSRELKVKEDSILSLSEQLEIKEEELRKKSESLIEAIPNNSPTTNGPSACLLTNQTTSDSSANSSVADINEAKNKKKRKKKNKDNAVTN